MDRPQLIDNIPCIADNPGNQSVFVRPDDTKFEVKGWAVSNDENAVLRILLDGNVVAENIARTDERKDIDTAISEM